MLQMEMDVFSRLSIDSMREDIVRAMLLLFWIMLACYAIALIFYFIF
jgi:hypothetical protein